MSELVGRWIATDFGICVVMEYCVEEGVCMDVVGWG
jgi:hypothetical protein